MTPARIKRQSRIPGSAYKMLVFSVVTLFLIGLIATLIGNITFTPSHTYYATFTDATGVETGDRVRISGVEVGSITSVKLEPVADGRQEARLGFTVRKGVPLYRDAHLTLRFENIVGQRYLAIDEQPGSSSSEPVGGDFGTGQTTPALDLTQLFNGFQPLLQALDPQSVNRVSYELVQAFQGESSTFTQLMADTASLTNHLADRDQVIGDLVTNLNAVLGTVGSRDRQLTGLIVQFRDLMTGLARDRGAVNAGLPQLARLLGGTTDFLSAVRDPLKHTVGGLERVAGVLARNSRTLDQSISLLPRKLRFMVRSGSYGSYFNFYVCGLEIRLHLFGSDTYLGTPGIGANERGTVCEKADK